MNILEIAQAFAYETNLPAPTTLLSLTDPADLQILNLIYAVSRDLRQDRCWPQQKKSYSFTLTAARVKYPLPYDFYSALLGTQWNTTTRLPLNGPMSDAMFTERLYGVVRLNSEVAFRIFGPDLNPSTSGGQVYIDPPPGGGEVINYEYVSKNLFLPPNWTASTVIAASSYRNANGIIFFTSAGGTTGTVPPSAAGLDGTVTWTIPATPYETVISNSDYSIFDDDVMIIGLKAKWYQMKGLGYEALQAEYQSKLDQAKGRWAGSFTGSFNRYPGNWLRYRPSTPGNWSF